MGLYKGRPISQTPSTIKGTILTSMMERAQWIYFLCIAFAVLIMASSKTAQKGATNTEVASKDWISGRQGGGEGRAVAGSEYNVLLLLLTITKTNR